MEALVFPFIAIVAVMSFVCKKLQDKGHFQAKHVAQMQFVRHTQAGTQLRHGQPGLDRKSTIICSSIRQDKFFVS